MTTDKIKKIILLIVLIVAFVIIQLLIKNNIIAISALGILLLFIIGYLKFSGSMAKKRKEKALQQGKKVRAKIISVKTFNRNSIILSLLVEDPEQFYVTSYILDNPSIEERSKYLVDQQLNIFVNPNNQNEVFIPEIKKERLPAQKNAFWGVFVTIAIVALSFGIPFFSAFFDTSDREFKDLMVIQTKGLQENIWQIKFESPRKIYFKIYNPITKETVKSFKDKKTNELDHYTNFSVFQQGQKVYIVGTGNTPVIDVYDATSLEKVSDIKKFEESEKIMRNGIASIEMETPYNRLTKDNIIEITTNDGNKCFFDIEQNKFFFSENDMKDFFEEADYNLISKQMFVFVLSNIPNSVDKHQLYIVESTNKKAIASLKSLAGSNSLNVEYFNENQPYTYRYCTLTPLCHDTYFLEGKFEYFDESIAIIHHSTAINETADELLTGIDKSGKTLFSINQNDFPNIKDMTEYNHKPNYDNKLKVIRNGNKIYFLFNKHGALCVDITTGKIVWKYEP